MPPSWLAKAVIYNVLIDRFSRGLEKDTHQYECEGPVFCGGNLRGVIERLSYIKDFGATAVWLTPFNTTSAFHGYHVKDFYGVDSRFGTLDDVRELVQKAHALGLKVIMDFVPNHVSHEHPFFQNARRDPESEYADWFFFEEWPDTYRTFLEFWEAPKLNLQHPAARKHVIDAALYWLDQGIDGFRVDHVVGIKHDFWRDFRHAVKKKNPTAVMIGEAAIKTTSITRLQALGLKHRWLIFLYSLFGLSTADSVVPQYVRYFDGMLDFRFMRLMRNHIAHPRWFHTRWLLRLRLWWHYAHYPSDYPLLAFLDNPDEERFLFAAGNNEQKLKEAVRIQFSQGRPVVITYGSEVGVLQTQSRDVPEKYGDLEIRKMMPWDRIGEPLATFYKEMTKSVDM